MIVVTLPLLGEISAVLVGEDGVAHVVLRLAAHDTLVVRRRQARGIVRSASYP